MEMRYRGPDVILEPDPTYAADVWGYLVQSPGGRYKTKVFDTIPALYQKDYIGAYYYTQRDGGQVSFYTYCFVDPALPLALRAKETFSKVAISGEIAAMASEQDYFSDAEFQVVKIKMEDEQILDLETPEQFIETLSFWWSVASADYFFAYVPRMQRVSRPDIAAFLEKYVLANVPVIAIRMNPADYKAETASLKAAGFITVSAETAFWWKDGSK